MSGATTITPTAIDAFVLIEFVQVVGRHRHDLGDLTTLAASIEDVGLLNPITLTRGGRLIAGQRRLEAFRQLGRSEIPARFVDSLDDAVRLLHAERDENTERKPMLLSELASLGEALYAIEAERAKDRMAAAGRSAAPGRPAERCDELVTPFAGRGDPGSEKNKTRSVVGEALGMSGSSYNGLRYVYEAAHDEDIAPRVRQVAVDALAEMDRTGKVNTGEQKVRAAVRANREALEAKAAALAAPPEPDPFDPPPATRVASRGDEWIPERGDSSPAAAERRRALIRHLGSKGWTSDQIADHLAMLPRTVRKIARDLLIVINADEALGVRTRKSIDSNRVVRETVQTLEALHMGVGLINFADLDVAEIQDWTDSLSESIRVLNRLNKRLKEMAQ